MFKFDGKEYRNLQEQVFKNKDDIANLIQGGNIAELGIKIINAENPLSSDQDLPDATTYDGDYGDGYIVGSATPFNLYVYSRSSDPNIKGYWFDWGLLNAPSTIQGPIGPQGIQGAQGVRGSFWYSQSGAPTNTMGVNENDQALDGSTGDTYQFVNGAWQITGNIRGPQGIQGIQGIMGPQGIQGIQGPQGPQGPQGQFIQIVGELDNVNQLPMIDTAPRYAAYLIPDTDGSQHVWLIIGDGTGSNPYLWHDAGGFGGGSKVLIDGAQQSEVDLKTVVDGGASYEIGEGTQVSSNGSEVTFSNLQVTGKNLAGQDVDTTAAIELPIAGNSEIEPKVVNNTLQLGLTDQVWSDINNLVDAAKPEEVQITAPTTSTNGQLSEEQLTTLQANKGAYLMFNNEIFRLQDSQHISGYLVYSHIGYDNTTATYKVKCITITINTRGWVLSERNIVSESIISELMTKTAAAESALDMMQREINTIKDDLQDRGYLHTLSINTIGFKAVLINNTDVQYSSLADLAASLAYNPQNPRVLYGCVTGARANMPCIIIANGAPSGSCNFLDFNNNIIVSASYTTAVTDLITPL